MVSHVWCLILRINHTCRANLRIRKHRTNDISAEFQTVVLTASWLVGTRERSFKVPENKIWNLLTLSALHSTTLHLDSTMRVPFWRQTALDAAFAFSGLHTGKTATDDNVSS